MTSFDNLWNDKWPAIGPRTSDQWPNWAGWTTEQRGWGGGWVTWTRGNPVKLIIRIIGELKRRAKEKGHGDDKKSVICFALNISFRLFAADKKRCEDFGCHYSSCFYFFFFCIIIFYRAPGDYCCLVVRIVGYSIWPEYGMAIRPSCRFGQLAFFSYWLSCIYDSPVALNRK